MTEKPARVAGSFPSAQTGRLFLLCDDLGRRTQLSRGNGANTSYGYDPVSRLASLSHNLAGTAGDLDLTFGYNPASQIVANERSNDAFSFVWANANVASAADGLNRLTSVGGTSIGHTDGRGNVTAIGSASYDYTAENRLAHGPGGTGLTYDPLGRLYYRGSTALGQTWMQSDGANLVAEYDSGGNVLRRFVFAPGIDEPIVWYEGAGVSSSTRRFLHSDERGSIVAVSDSSGNLSGSINRYDDYGAPQGGVVNGRFGYTGQAWLPEIQMYYYRARIYNPDLGRFMQTDPIGYGDGMNLYAYVGNDPVNSADPSGLSKIDKPKPPACSGNVCVTTGSRIPSAGDFICRSCSGSSTASMTGGMPPRDSNGGGLGLYKATDWDNATKTPLSTWFNVRWGAEWGFAAQGSGLGSSSRQRVSPTLRALLSDADVNQQMGLAWALSMGDGATEAKNEYGFWIWQVGSNFVPDRLLRGDGQFIFHARSARPDGANIFFHVHPFYAGEINGVTSIGLSTGDWNIARDLSVMVVAAARPGRGLRGFVFFEGDCRRGC